MKDSQNQSPPLRVDVGQHVEIELVLDDGEIERMAFDLVPDRSADFARGYLGESTPLAKAILGQEAGSAIPYRNGDARQVRILTVSAGTVHPSAKAAAERQEAIKKAEEEAQRTQAILFASSYDGKWGDYDPDGV